MTEYEIVADFYGDHPDKERKIAETMRKIELGEPCAYLLGEWFFYKNIFKVNRDCLIPRPDTERVVEKAVSIIPKSARFADLCTGSGCIALSVLADRSDLSAVAIDVSCKAISAACENARLMDLSSRAKFICADLLTSDPLGGELFDCIISNPPYIKTDALADFPSLVHEPLLALDGGSDGLMFYREFIKKYSKNLTDTGFFIFEIGYDQRDDITALASENGFSCSVERDYGGNDRVAVLRR